MSTIITFKYIMPYIKSNKTLKLRVKSKYYELPKVKRFNDLYSSICIALFKLGCINQG